MSPLPEKQLQRCLRFDERTFERERGSRGGERLKSGGGIAGWLNELWAFWLETFNRSVLQRGLWFKTLYEIQLRTVQK